MAENQLRSLVFVSLVIIPFSSLCFAGLFDGIAAAVNPNAIKPDTPLISCDGVEPVQGTEADLQQAKDDVTKREAWCSQPNINNLPNPSCTNLLEDLRQRRNGIQCYLQKSQTLQQKESSEGDACSKNGYKDCYMGIKWGDTITKDTLLGLKCPSYYGPKVGIDQYPDDFAQWSSCDDYLFSTVGKARSELGIGNPQCPLVTLDNKLVGFVYGRTGKEGYSDDEIQFLVGKLKSKYGSSPKKKSCTISGGAWSLPQNIWENANGIQIQTIQTHGMGGQEFLVRYVNIEALKKISAEVSAKVGKGQSDAEDQKLEGLGQGL